MNSRANQIMTPEIATKINDEGIIAVIILDDVENTLPLAEALLKGGVSAIELTLRTDAAMAAAKIIKKQVPEITLGFGTVLSIDQVKACADIGADFAVSPGCNPKIIEAARKHNLSFAPGIMTPSDIEFAVEVGCRNLKFFPAESTGGMNHLKSMSAPYNFLDLKFIPLGGVNMNNAREYLESDLISAVGGSWVAKRSLIQDKNWDAITQNAREIKALIKQIRD